MLPSFPNPIDGVSVRVVAAEVVALNCAALLTGQLWVLPVVAADFSARALAGPRFSPLATIGRELVRPRLGVEPRPVAGPPKRFAATVGAALMTAASVLAATGHRRQAQVVAGAVVGFASLEAFAGICVGCKVFNAGMKLGLAPDDVCLACADITRRRRPAA